MELVLDRVAVENFVRDAKLTVTNGLAYVVLLACYAGLRVVADVPYFRAAVGLYVAVAIAAVVVKRRLLHERLDWLAAAAAAGLAANLAVLVLLVQVNRGTLFAEAAAALVGVGVVHLVDRVSLARA